MSRDDTDIKPRTTKTNFEKLEVYQLAETLADTLWDVVTDWESLARDTVGKQLIRAADGIGANIAEGAGRGSFQDNRRFIRIARGSLNETKHWLRRAWKRKLLDEKTVAALKPLLDELARRLNAYLNSVGRTRRPIAVKTTNNPIKNPRRPSLGFRASSPGLTPAQSKKTPQPAKNNQQALISPRSGQRTTDIGASRTNSKHSSAREAYNGQRTTDNGHRRQPDKQQVLISPRSVQRTTDH
jgi:four helix bundle protein